MTKTVPTVAAAMLACLIFMASVFALGHGLSTPQPRGVLFWLVTAGFAIQGIGSAIWLTRLVLALRRNATSGGTAVPAHD